MKQEYAKFNGKILKVKANICGFIYFENGEKAIERNIIFCTKEGIDLGTAYNPMHDDILKSVKTAVKKTAGKTPEWLKEI